MMEEWVYREKLKKVWRHMKMWMKHRCLLAQKMMTDILCGCRDNRRGDRWMSTDEALRNWVDGNRWID